MGRLRTSVSESRHWLLEKDSFLQKVIGQTRSPFSVGKFEKRGESSLKGEVPLTAQKKAKSVQNESRRSIIFWGGLAPNAGSQKAGSHPGLYPISDSVFVLVLSGGGTTEGSGEGCRF